MQAQIKVQKSGRVFIHSYSKYSILGLNIDNIDVFVWHRAGDSVDFHLSIKI